MQGVSLDVHFHYMDYYGRNAAAQALHADGQRALAEIEAFKPSIVFTLDDGAIKEVMMPLVGRTDHSVVFSRHEPEPNARNYWAFEGPADVGETYCPECIGGGLETQVQRSPCLLRCAQWSKVLQKLAWHPAPLD